MDVENAHYRRGTQYNEDGPQIVPTQQGYSMEVPTQQGYGQDQMSGYGQQQFTMNVQQYPPQQQGFMDPSQQQQTIPMGMPTMMMGGGGGAQQQGSGGAYPQAGYAGGEGGGGYSQMAMGMEMPMGGAGGGMAAGVPGLLGDPMANNMMMNFGMSYGTKVFKNTKDNFSRWLPLHYVKYYFHVNNNYVKNKIKLLLFPLRHRFRRREMQQDSFGGVNTAAPLLEEYNYLPPSEDINAPDMYIPLMAFITYILLVGLFAGLGHTTATFTPEVLVGTGSSCALLLAIEVAFIRLASYILQVPKAVYTLDVVCWTSYRYVGATVCLMLKPLIPPSAFLGLWLMFALFHAFFLRQCLHAYWTDTGATLSMQVNYFLYTLAGLQLPAFSWLMFL